MSCIDFRNCKYQGSSTHMRPQQFGLALFDTMTLCVSNWEGGQAHGPTVVFQSNSKFMYGQWLNDLPHGVNVLRFGETTVFATFEKGEVKGQFLIVFRESKLGVIAENWSIVRQIDQADPNTLMKEMGFYTPVYQSIRSFLKEQLTASHPIKYEKNKDSGECFYGFSNGLGIVFDSKNGVKSFGVLSSSHHLIGVGIKFQSDFTEQGDFLTNETIKYSENRPDKQISDIFKKSQLISINFRNDYLKDSFPELAKSIQQLAQRKIKRFAHSSSVDHHKQKKTFVLQEQQKKQNLDLQKLRKMREQIYKSVKYNSRLTPNRSKEEVVYRVKQENRQTIQISLKDQEKPIDHQEFALPQRLPVTKKDNQFETQAAEHISHPMKYESLQQRRERILNDFKRLKSEQQKNQTKVAPHPSTHPIIRETRSPDKIIQRNQTPIKKYLKQEFKIQIPANTIPVTLNKTPNKTPIMTPSRIKKIQSEVRHLLQKNNENAIKPVVESRITQYAKQCKVKTYEISNQMKSIPFAVKSVNDLPYHSPIRKTEIAYGFKSTNVEPSSPTPSALTRNKSVKKYNYLADDSLQS